MIAIFVSSLNEFSLLQKNAQKIPSYKFLPLMYQLAARMGTKMMGGLGFHEVLNNVIIVFLFKDTLMGLVVPASKQYPPSSEQLQLSKLHR